MKDYPNRRGRKIISLLMVAVLLAGMMQFTRVAGLAAPVTTYNYRYFVEVYPGQPVTAQNTIVLKNVTYVLMEEYNQSSTGDLMQKPINGCVNVQTVWSSGGTSYPWLSYSYNGTAWIAPGNSNTSSTYFRCFFYTRSVFPLTFDCGMGGGSVQDVPKPRSIGYGVPLGVPPDAPTLTGFIFVGWYKDAEHTVQFDWDVLMPAAPLTAFAAWIPIEYTVRFFDNYGDTQPIAERSVGYNDYLVLNENTSPYKVGEISPYGAFIGWSLAVNGTDLLLPFSSDMPITTDVNLYAQWYLSGFTVSYDKGRGSGTAPEDKNMYSIGTSVILPDGSGLIPPAGEVFIGWKAQQDVSDSVYYPGNPITVNGDMRMVAQYTPEVVVNDCTIIYDPGTQGTWLASNETYTVRSGAPLHLISIDPATSHKPNYSFDGWDKPLASPVTGSETYTAQWKLDTYTVTVNESHAANSGGGRTYAPGAEVLIDAGSREGYTFTGWTVNSKNVSLSDAGNPGNEAPNGVGSVAKFTMPAAHVTITANWTEDAPPPPGPSDPGPSEPEPSDPGPSDPEPTDPEPSNPAPSEQPQIPGGTDFYTPPVPMSPGNQVVADESGGWLELDEEGVPLGKWDWDDNTGEWVFEDFTTPLSGMPQTGISSSAIFFYIVMIAILLLCSGLVLMHIKSKKNKKQD